MQVKFVKKDPQVRRLRGKFEGEHRGQKDSLVGLTSAPKKRGLTEGDQRGIGGSEIKGKYPNPDTSFLYINKD